jgi:phospholipid/cholesterol/gamma-HCH transport system substrate-binding protein
METRASYVLIGGFVLASVVGAALFVIWLGKLSFDREWTVYDVVFDEAVTGLTLGGAVQYQGIQVGEVRALSLDPDDPRRAIARVRVGAGTPVRVDTRARLTFTGLTGVASIQLFDGTPTAPPLTAADGTVPVIVADRSSFASLLASGEEIATSTDALLRRLSAAVTDESVANLSATLAHIEQITGALAGRDDAIAAMVDDLAAASGSLRRVLDRTDALLVRLDAVADRAEGAVGDVAGELAATLSATRAAAAAVDRAASGLDAAVDENRAAVARFSREGLSQVAPAVADLRATLRPLRRLADELAAEPSVLLRGAPPVRTFDAP